MRKSILITRLWPEAVLRAFQEKYDVGINRSDQPMSQSALSEAMTQFDILCPTITDGLGAQMFGRANQRTRLIANYGAGVEHIDLLAAKNAGITVTNTPDVLTQSTAELCILLMLMVARRAGEGERQLRSGDWPGWHPVHLMGQSLHGKRLGLIGYGRIGQEVARMARALWGMDIAYHARRPVDAAADAMFQPSLSVLLARSDVVSVHCPGGAQTHHLLNTEMLAQMKPSSILINTARGTVIDEEALVAALKQGALAGAGLDVYAQEPMVHPGLCAMENVVLLPHLGSATLETRTEMGMRVLANVDAFCAGQEPNDRVA